MSTNIASIAQSVLAYAERRGLERTRIFSALGVDEHGVERNGRIECDLDTLIWNEVERQLGEPDLGMTIATSWDADVFAAVPRAPTLPRTLKEAIADAAALSRHVKDDLHVALIPQGRSLVVAAELPRGHKPWSRPLADSWLFAYLTFARRWTRKDVRLREARFTYPTPRDPTAYEAMLGGPVYFGQPVTAFVLDAATCELPLPGRRADAAAWVEARLRSGGDAIRERDPASEVRATIRAAINDNDLHLTRVARRLGTSTRSLQRQLAQHGLAFGDLVADVRSAMSLSLIAMTDLPIEEVGARLGYADAKAFRRAFRRWMGLNPSDVRGLRANGAKCPRDDAGRMSRVRSA